MRKKFGQPSLVSALIASGSSGDKVQNCLGMPGIKFYFKEEWRGLHRGVHHMLFFLFQLSNNLYRLRLFDVSKELRKISAESMVENKTK